MLRSIVLPLDGTDFSEQAIPLAATLAHRSGAGLSLVLVHSTDPNNDNLATYTPYRFEGLEQDAERWDGEQRDGESRYLSEQAGRIAQEYGAAAGGVVLRGPVSHSLAEYVATNHPDLVVMTTHARAGFTRAWLGSVADRLLHHMNVPLLLLRGDAPPRMPDKLVFHNILIPLDGSTLAESVLESALSLAAISDARITLLTAMPSASAFAELAPIRDPRLISDFENRRAEAIEYLEQAADRISGVTANVDIGTVECTRAAEGILEYARHTDVDLIAMATHGRGGLTRLLLGSVADDVLHGAQVPLLIYRPPAGRLA